MKGSIVAFVLLAQNYDVASADDSASSWANIVSVGQRPYYLIDQMKPSSVKDKLGMLLTSSSSSSSLGSCLLDLSTMHVDISPEISQIMLTSLSIFSTLFYPVVTTHHNFYELICIIIPYTTHHRPSSCNEQRNVPKQRQTLPALTSPLDIVVHVCSSPNTPTNLTRPLLYKVQELLSVMLPSQKIGNWSVSRINPIVYLL